MTSQPDNETIEDTPKITVNVFPSNTRTIYTLLIAGFISIIAVSMVALIIVFVCCQMPKRDQKAEVGSQIIDRDYRMPI